MQKNSAPDNLLSSVPFGIILHHDSAQHTIADLCPGNITDIKCEAITAEILPCLVLLAVLPVLPKIPTPDISVHRLFCIRKKNCCPLTL